MSVLPYTETFTGCLSWPKPAHPADPAVPTHASMDATHVPVLILNGALDSLTPAAGGAHIQRQIGSAARQIVVPGMVHLVGLDDRYGCGASLVQQFFRSHGRGSVDQDCVARVPEIHAVGTFPRTVAVALPASGPASLSLRRQAAVALAAVGDAATRYNYVDGNRDLGLRGGRVSYRPGANLVTATLHAVRWTDDASVSGTVRSDQIGLVVSAHVTLKPDHGPAVTFAISWNTSGRGHQGHGAHRRTDPHRPRPLASFELSCTHPAIPRWVQDNSVHRHSFAGRFGPSTSRIDPCSPDPPSARWWRPVVRRPHYHEGSWPRSDTTGTPLGTSSTLTDGGRRDGQSCCTEARSIGRVNGRLR